MQDVFGEVEGKDQGTSGVSLKALDRYDAGINRPNLPMQESILPKLRAATADVGNGLSMLRVAVDAEVGLAKVRGDTQAVGCLQDALMHLDEALESLVNAGRSLDDIKPAQPGEASAAQ